MSYSIEIGTYAGKSRGHTEFRVRNIQIFNIIYVHPTVLRSRVRLRVVIEHRTILYGSYLPVLPYAPCKIKSLLRNYDTSFAKLNPALLIDQRGASATARWNLSRRPHKQHCVLRRQSFRTRRCPTGQPRHLAAQPARARISQSDFSEGDPDKAQKHSFPAPTPFSLSRPASMSQLLCPSFSSSKQRLRLPAKSTQWRYTRAPHHLQCRGWSRPLFTLLT